MTRRSRSSAATTSTRRITCGSRTRPRARSSTRPSTVSSAWRTKSCARKRASLAAPGCGQLAGTDEAQVIGKNFGVVKRERRRRRIGREQSDSLGVVGGTRLAMRSSDVHHRDGLAARIAVRTRVDAEQRAQLDLERGLLAQLADGGVLDLLADVDEAAGKRPSEGKVAPLDQHDIVSDFGDHVSRDRRAYWLGHAWRLTLGASRR